MARTREEKVRRMDAKKNAQGHIIFQKERTTMYKMAGQCNEGDQNLERKS